MGIEFSHLSLTRITWILRVLALVWSKSPTKNLGMIIFAVRSIVVDTWRRSFLARPISFAKITKRLPAHKQSHVLTRLNFTLQNRLEESSIKKSRKLLDTQCTFQGSFLLLLHILESCGDQIEKIFSANLKGFSAFRCFVCTFESFVHKSTLFFHCI